MRTTLDVDRAALFDRSLAAHLPAERLDRLQDATVLIAGLGGGSNIVELLVRKGIGGVVIADPDHYEPHNIRQRGSLASSWGRNKAQVMAERVRDVNPTARVRAHPEGVTLANVEPLVATSQVIVDMLDFHALTEKVALYRAARAAGKTVVTTPSVINGAVLYVFGPAGPTFEAFFGYRAGDALGAQALRFLERLIPHYPPEGPEAMYAAAARGERTLPLDAVGVEQAAVLAVAAVENLLLARHDRVPLVPRGIQVDVSDPVFGLRIIDWTADQAESGQ